MSVIERILRVISPRIIARWAIPTLFFALSTLTLGPAARAADIPDSEIQNKRCLTCHGDPAMADMPYRERLQKVDATNAPATEPAKRPGLYFPKDTNDLHLSAHKNETCISCHPAASILPHSIPQPPASCDSGPTCHAQQLATYRASYHGQVTQLGGTLAATCTDCHGTHNIRPIADPQSPLNASHKLATCQKCHQGAGPMFASFAPHADFRDSARYPILHGVYLYFVIIISASFGFFGLHGLLWLARSVIERILRGPNALRAKPDYSKGAIQRFTRADRLNHGLVIVTFFGLALTGLPLLYADKQWGHALAGLFGGPRSCGIMHRIFAVMLIGNFVAHGIGVARRFKRMGVKPMLFGPTTMLPRFKDLKDCLGMFRWFFAGGTKPKFDRWTYWEKFDYVAEVGGAGIIGISGLLLWFPVFFSSYLPGWMFNVATVVHGFEALLAVGFIFTIHFFNAHLRMEKFPVDDVMFTGRLPEEEFRHERSAEYERVFASGEITKLRVPAPPAWYRHFAVFLGIAAMTVGTIIVALIILAALRVI